jgi:lipoprotein-anchoring transpeptidase ErfK/SrfK
MLGDRRAPEAPSGSHRAPDRRVRCDRVPRLWPNELKATATLSGRLATVGFLALLTAGCGASRPTLTQRRESPAPSSSTAAVTVPVTPARLIATASSSRVDIYDDPSTPTPRVVLPNPWFLNGATADPIPQVFRVIRRRPDGWVQVQLPQRPNGQTGWIPPGEVGVTQTPYRIEVSLSTHHITVFDKSAVLYQGPVATGAAGTPTPTGSYYLRVLLKNSDPSSVYGPFAFGLSAHSEALTTFSGSDAEIGLHGNNDTSTLGRNVSHGCIRMDNTAITRLSKILPLGTPVNILS